MNSQSGTSFMKLGDGFGQLMTSVAREKAWEDYKYAEGIVFLTDSLHGITNDQAREVISGKKKLVNCEDGVNVELVDDDWTPPDLEQMVKDTLKIANSILQRTEKRGGSWFTQMPRSEQERFERDARDLIEIAKTNPREALSHAKQFEKCCWDKMLEVSKEVTERWAFCKKAVQKRDAKFYNKELSKAKSSILDDLLGNNLHDIAVNPFISEEQKRRLMMVAKGQTEAMKGNLTITIDPEFNFDTAWVDREGNYFGCLPGQHIPLAHLLVEEYYPDVDGDREQILENHGWLKCTDRDWYSTNMPPNRTQLNVVARWVERYGEPFKWNGQQMIVRELKSIYPMV